MLPEDALVDPDIERQMNLMRDVQRQASFQLLAQDLEGELTVEKLADQLSALADLLLTETIRRAWPLVNRMEGAAPRFAVIAYGKLGGKELGYASDLDLVFLFDDPREDAAEVVGMREGRAEPIEIAAQLVAAALELAYVGAQLGGHVVERAGEPAHLVARTHRNRDVEIAVRHPCRRIGKLHHRPADEPGQ